IEFLETADYEVNNNRFEILITGVGMMVSTYTLTEKILRQPPHYVIQAGIAGSFTPELPPGSVVMVNDETIGDCGVIEEGVFKDSFDLRLADPSAFPFIEKKLINPNCSNWIKYGFRFVSGVTVNNISTGPEIIHQLKLKYGSEIESMEGAALHYVCLRQKIPFLQIRSISNYVGERNKANWKLRESIDNLNETLIKIIQQPI
ncbi:MAG TPA: futalosine hydrolase, partial [Ignavibacteriaceae bacterium]